MFQKCKIYVVLDKFEFHGWFERGRRMMRSSGKTKKLVLSCVDSTDTFPTLCQRCVNLTDMGWHTSDELCQGCCCFFQHLSTPHALPEFSCWKSWTLNSLASGLSKLLTCVVWSYQVERFLIIFFSHNIAPNTRKNFSQFLIHPKIIRITHGNKISRRK